MKDLFLDPMGFQKVALVFLGAVDAAFHVVGIDAASSLVLFSRLDA
jgi:hypothetical protein